MALTRNSEQPGREKTGTSQRELSEQERELKRRRDEAYRQGYQEGRAPAEDPQVDLYCGSCHISGSGRAVFYVALKLLSSGLD